MQLKSGRKSKKNEKNGDILYSDCQGGINGDRSIAHANGNTVKKIAGGVVTSYVYNTEDCLTQVWNGEVTTGTLITSYYYDPFGRRLWKDVGSRTYFHYANEGLIGEYDGYGVEIKTYGYRPKSTWTTAPLFMKIGTEYHFYQNDHLGTPQKMTTVSGAVVWSAKYSLFGKAEIDPASTITNNLRFGGQYFDQETSLNYNWHRYYDIDCGRYMSIDPIGFKGGFNLYLYVEGNPLNKLDPLGLLVWRCTRPLNGQPGEKTYPIFNHAYVCATDKDGNIHCGSTTPKNENIKWYEYFTGTPARGTTPYDGDYYEKSACELVDEKDEWEPNCVESCLISKIEKESRPPFVIGKGGTYCHPWTDEAINACTQICSKKFRDSIWDRIKNNPKPPTIYKY